MHNPQIIQLDAEYERKIPNIINLRSVLKTPNLKLKALKQEREGDRKKGVNFKLEKKLDD